ncbi:MAG: D-glycero-beta-D-manno-heptose-7-phosphate kinase [Alphaproteobacteria bacterium]|nr:D-glycero-beta-D-manno-heptose-7-phosphate kinase [Alphaproteobacteria bacterium]
MNIDQSAPVERLESLLCDLSQSRVLVVGDIILDRFIYGQVERISPESPVPVLAIHHEDVMLGGAGNAVSNLAGLAAPCQILSVIGADENGGLLKAHLEKLGVSADGLIEDDTRPTTIKSRFLARHQQLLRTDFETKNPISDTIAARVISAAEAMIKASKAVILSDYGKGLLRPDVIAAVIKAARAQGVPVIVDPKGQDFSIYRGASAVTPNKKELQDATRGMSVDSDENVVEAAQSLIESCGIENVVATRSAEGMSVISAKGAVHLPTIDIEVFDVSGAGDTVIATIAAILGAGGSLVEAATLANMAGSIVVTKVGTAPIRKEELHEALHEASGNVLAPNFQKGERGKTDRSRRGDILGWEEAAEQVRRWKARGLKVGFTNGCFDILHYGHVSYLNNARDRCDRLVVGLNTDAAVKLLKGPSRPVHDEQSRANVLAALGSVDAVVLFGAEKAGDDNTACALLELLKPDTYFKGGDYTVEQIPEAPTVMAYGGVVDVMPVYEGHSTTGSIDKITQNAR